MTTCRNIVNCAVIVAISLIAAQVNAQTYTWIQGGDVTNWEDPANWDSGGVPPQTTAGSSIIFSNSTSGNIGNDPSSGKVTFGSISWETSFELRDFGNYTTADALVVDTGTSADAIATSSNNATLSAYYATWLLNSNLVVTGDGRLIVRAYNANGVRGDGGFIVEDGAELYFNRTHGSDDYVYTGGVTIKDGGVVDVTGRSTGMGALGDGLLTIEEGGRLQAFDDAFDQDALFDINSSTSTDPFISGGGSNWNASGEWAFDLTDAGNEVGDSWNIIDIAGAATYDQANFSVLGFMEDNGVWIGEANNAIYEFDESTGVLSVTGQLAVPEPASVAIWSILGLGIAGFGYHRVRRKS